MSVLHELYAIKIRDHRLDAKIILSVTKCGQKCLRNRTTNKKIQILREKWAKSQTISKEKYKRCLVRKICWPVPERGRSVSYRESWHMCRILGVIHRTSSLLVWPPGKSETKVLGSTISLICDMASTSRMHTAISSGQCLYIWREKLWVDTGVNIAQSQRNLSLIVWITVDFLFTGLWVSLRLKCDEMNIRQLATFNMHNYERLHDFRDFTIFRIQRTNLVKPQSYWHMRHVTFLSQKAKGINNTWVAFFWHEALLPSFPKVTLELTKGTRGDVSISIWKPFTARGFLH